MLILALAQPPALPPQLHEAQAQYGPEMAPPGEADAGSEWVDSFFVDPFAEWLDDWLFALDVDDGGFVAALDLAPFNYEFKKKSEGKDWKQVAGKWKVRKGAFLARRPMKDVWNSVSQPADYADFDFSARIRRADASTNCANTVFVRGVAVNDNPLASKPWRSGYLFQYADNGQISVWRVASGKVTPLQSWKASSAVNRGTWNVIRVVGRGKKMTYFLNGMTVWRGKDSTYKSGQVGIGFFNGCGKGRFSIDSAVMGEGGPTVWRPAVETSWQWQLQGRLNSSIDAEMYDIDLFENSARAVANLRRDGRRVVCYISVGSWEDWRPDAGKFPEEVLGKQYEGFPDESWLDIRRLDVLGPLLRARFDMCRSKGFDAIEPDNIDGYTNDTGFPLTAADQLKFNWWLAAEAHARGLSIGLKNDPDQAKKLLDDFDWALTEDCFAEGWCGQMAPFVAAGKPVFAAEYTDNWGNDTSFCKQANRRDFNAILKHRDLDSFVVPCR